MLLAVVLAAAAAAPADAGPPARDADGYVAAVQGAARARRLAEERAWLTLLHWHPHLFGGESDADGPAFFLAAEGKRDPAAELDATLAALFAAPDAAAPDGHARCRFPARAAWLARRLSIAPERLPELRCEGFETFRARVEARSVTLVFSSYYLNNPASAFGHTFLRLNKSDGSVPGRRFELADQGVDYAATADTGNALLYAFKGLTGLFQGHWTDYPYFYKVREYADSESRDLWEYDLDLDAEETALLVAHLWELGQTWFDYFYVTENCSYGILAALEAAAPRLTLLRHVGYVVLPADTVKALYANPGLVRAVHYRPSIRTQFQVRAATLSSAELDAVGAFAADPAASTRLAAVSEARALDAALDLVDFRHGRELIDGVVTPAAVLKQRLMERRSALGVQSDELVVRTPRDQEPHLGHGSLRTGVGGGSSTRQGALAVYDFRLALHDLADPPAGYPDLAELEFLPVRVRYEARGNAVSIEEAQLARIVSLTDFGSFDHHVAWRARLGAVTVRDAGCRGCLAGAGAVGGGLAKVFAGGSLTTFAMVDTELAGAPRMDGIDGAGVRVAVGPSAGLRLRAGDHVAMLAEAGWRWLPGATTRTTFDARLRARVHLGGWSLWAEASRWPIETQILAGVSLFL